MAGASHRFLRIKLRAEHISLLLVAVAYTIIIAVSIDKCYFWDNVQFTSKEAHWYYNNNFSSLLLPGFSKGSEIFGSGCHPPLPGIITASLWKIFGQHLWISHLFIAFWAALLIYSTARLIRITIPLEIAGFLLPVLLLDSTILSQIFIASPDLILLASFVTAVIAVIEKKRWLLTITLIFLVLINGRGAMTGGILLLFYIIHQLVSEMRKLTFKLFLECLLPFIPAFTMAGFYYVAYIGRYGWIFNDPDSPWYSGWQRPAGLLHLLKNVAAFCLRLGENGRFFIYLLGLSVLISLYRRKKFIETFKRINLSLTSLFVLLFMFFFYFVLTTTSAMTSRYYMGMVLIANIMIFRVLTEWISLHKIKILTIVALTFLITGNFWIYPDKISKAWDATLAHLPYYELREECLDYLAKNNFDTVLVSGGFCFKGNQRYFDLKKRDLYISERADNKYFIYSNISNIDDTFINELNNKGKWTEIKTFSRGFVTLSIFENRLFIEPD